MRAKSKKLLVACCVVACGSVLATGAALTNEVASASTLTHTATFVETNTDRGRAYWNNYGADGHVVAGAAGIYSNMYTDKGVSATTLHTGGKMATARFFWNYGVDTTDTTYGLDESAPISKWGSPLGITSNNNTIQDYKLYKPGTELPSDGRWHNTWNESVAPGREMAMWFDLDETAPIYFTVNVADWNNKVSTTTPITVSVYGLEENGTYASGQGSVMKDFATQTWDEIYGAGSTPLATATVTAQGTYVTFKLEGAGRYQVVAYAGDTTLAFANRPNPMFNGFFFDKTQPGVVTGTMQDIEYNLPAGATNHSGNPAQYEEGKGALLSNPSYPGYEFKGWFLEDSYTTQVTEISKTDTGKKTLYAKFDPIVKSDNIDMTTRGNWEGTYGKDAYIIWTSEYVDSDEDGTKDKDIQQAYTKGIYTSEGSAYTGKITYDVPANANLTKGEYAMAAQGGYAMSNLLTRYGYHSTGWDSLEKKNWTANPEWFGDMLNVPGSTTEKVNTRVGCGAANQAASFAFTLSEAFFDRYEYVDISFYHSFAFNHSVKSDDAHAAVYQPTIYKGKYYTYHSTAELKAQFDSMTPVSISKAPYVYEAGQMTAGTTHTGFYATYRFTEAGDYTFVNWADTTQANDYRANVAGVFFDYGTAKARYTITYNGIGAGSGVTMPNDYVTEFGANSSLTLPTPTKAYAEFDGWYDAQTGGNKVTTLADKNTNLSLWPRFNNTEWEVSYDFGSYTGKVYLDENRTQELTKTKFDYYTAITLPTTLYLEGDYEFKGWYEDQDYEYDTTGFGAGENAQNWTFYAKIEAAPVLPTVSNITYVLDGGVPSGKSYAYR